MNQYLGRESVHGDSSAIKLYNKRKLKDAGRKQPGGGGTNADTSTVFDGLTGINSASDAPNYYNIPSTALLLLQGYRQEEIQQRVTCWNIGLQHVFDPQHALPGAESGSGSDGEKFDVIWIQWVLGHLSDLDYIEFFRRCARSLSAQGLIILKDNVTDDYSFMIDLEDSSVARSLHYHRLLLALTDCGLVIVREQLQRDFPADLCPVYMIAVGLPSTTAPAV